MAITTGYWRDKPKKLFLNLSYTYSNAKLSELILIGTVRQLDSVIKIAEWSPNRTTNSYNTYNRNWNQMHKFTESNICWI